MNEEIQQTAVTSFIEKMGIAIEADGLPRIAGRILGYLIIYGGPVSFNELSEILQVSRGSISTNARLLSSLGVIELVSYPGDRQNYYQLAERPGAKIIDAAISRFKDIEQIIDSGRNTIPTSIQGSASRLREMQNFYSIIWKQFDVVLKQLEAEASTYKSED